MMMMMMVTSSWSRHVVTFLALLCWSCGSSSSSSSSAFVVPHHPQPQPHYRYYAVSTNNNNNNNGMIDYDRVEGAVHNLRLQLEKKDAALVEAHETIKDMEQRQDDLFDQIQQLQQQLQQSQKQYTTSQQELSRALSRISHLEKKFEKASIKPVMMVRPNNMFFNNDKPKQELLPQINNWRVTEHGEVMGTVTQHPAIKDGDDIITSPISNPSAASSGAVVVTRSGSKYQLGTPFESPSNKKQSPSSLQPSTLLQKKKKNIHTGHVIGDGKYVLSGQPKKSTNGRSLVYTCYETNANLQPVGEALAVKITSNKAAMKREWTNLHKFWSGVQKGAIITGMEFLPVADSGSSTYAGKCALVMERGTEDLKEYRQRGPLDPIHLKSALTSAVQCLKAIHASKMVWTDLKSENFILVQHENESDISFKAIDLESAMPFRGNPLDYTPEACPPEFARAFREGDAHDFLLEYNYDVWSLGMLAYELSTGNGFFDGWKPETIMDELAQANLEPPSVDTIQDEKLADLISQCLSLDPKRRPTIAKISKHPYFGGSSLPPKNIFGW